MTPVKLTGVEQAPSTTSRSLAENNLLEQTSVISKKLREMVSRNTNKDMSAVLEGEPKEESEMDEIFDEMCLKKGTFDKIQLILTDFIVLAERNCERIVIKDDDGDGNGDNFLVNDINVNEHYVTRDDLKNPKMKNKKR